MPKKSKKHTFKEFLPRKNPGKMLFIKHHQALWKFTFLSQTLFVCACYFLTLSVMISKQFL